MCYGKRKNPIVFCGGQRLFGVTGGQNLKTLLTGYFKMLYVKSRNLIVFGGGQRSYGVTRGQTMKTLLTGYLKIGSLDRFDTRYVDALW
ncbi:hypothetical protein HOLleu_09138 [Holothuria leucospilota]|uniref:Uncharacterized protein n=1 Tax=Holothuria leucospilota TaxID=206669 RepID=A0A9Q1CJS2_HOLLE|nr:hypothetical protein HOLleu_09138 [Holothuria leucospilota]